MASMHKGFKDSTDAINSSELWPCCSLHIWAESSQQIEVMKFKQKTDLEVDCLSLYNSNEGKSEAISITLILHEMPVDRLLESNRRTSSSAAPAALGDRALKIPAL